MKKLHLQIAIILSIFFAGCGASKTQSQTKKTEKEISEQDKMKFDFLFFNANKEKMIGNNQLATNLFQQCIELNPTVAAPYYELANLFENNNQNKEAEGYVKKAVDIDGKNYWYRYLYAFILQKNNKIEESSKQFQILLQNDPGNIDLLYGLAGTQLFSGKYEESIKTYDLIEKEVGITEEISLQKQKIYIKLNNIEKAAGELKKLAQHFPDEIKYKGFLADMYLANNMTEKAFEIYQEILAKNPNDPLSHLALYEYYKNKGDKENALKELKLVFENKDFGIDTKMQVLLYYYSASEKDVEQKKEAYELSQLLIKAHPNDAKSYTIYADLLYRDKKLDSAKENYLKAIEFDSSKFAIWNQVIMIESELMDIDGMLKHSKTAIDLFPSQPIFYFFYGISNLQKKNFKEAADYLTIGKDYSHNNQPLLAQFYANLGDCHNQLKEYEKSDGFYDKALSIEPNNIYVLNNYSYYLSLRGENLDKAEKMSAKTNELEPNQPNYEDTYAWILYKQGKYIAAKEWLEKAITNGGKTNAVIIEHLGDVNAKLGDINKAVELWINAKSLGDTSDLLDKKINDKKLYE
ncbi:MAG: tetratricopeptide repeat protein [Flavobacteriales bacterium]|nr:tetratricopeptide repeat protein [Flavobacteriales bacterium]